MIAGFLASFYGAECKRLTKSGESASPPDYVKKIKKYSLEFLIKLIISSQLAALHQRRYARVEHRRGLRDARMPRAGNRQNFALGDNRRIKKCGGVEKLVLRVNLKQHPAVKLYKSFGFAITETSKIK